MLYMELSKGQRDEIERLTNTATEVYGFIMGLPSPLGEFVFKRIVENAYEIASVLPPEVVKRQLVEAISIHKESSKDLFLIYKYLGVVDHYKEIDGLIMEKDRLIKRLLDYCSFDNLPSQDLLIRAYTCFSPGAEDDEWLENLKASVRDKITGIIQNINDIGTLSDNCFHELGYKTLYLNWISGDCSDFNKQFIDWYGKGKILNYVIDTIYKCNVYQISFSLWRHIQAECKTHRDLNNAFQACYDSYRKFSNLPEKKFEYEGKEDNDKENVVLALPQILIDPSDGNKESNYATSEMVYNLHSYLCARNMIDCTEEDFRAVFGGREKYAEPIKWTSTQLDLANFLYVVRGKNTRDKNYTNDASKVFIQKNGKPCSSVTLNQEDTTAERYKEFKKILINIGLKR